MHPISFMLKRAHRRTVLYSRDAVEKVPGMTPARFDLLYVLRRVALTEFPPPGPFDGAEDQISLRKKLGLHRSTVSKMLKRLEQMGWIVKTRCMTDRRTFDISLTPEGLKRIWQAMRRVFRPRKLKKVYERLYRPRPPEDPIELLYLGQWKGDYESARAAQEELDAKKVDPNWDPLAGQRPAVEVLDEIYGSLRKIARYFGDRSNVWFDLGAGRPTLAPEPF